jgi:NAD(P)-dependent dehydrogenase (short-subunit alcohol dehydrogenase family)
VKDPGDLPGFFHCDVSSWESQLELFAKAVQELGRLDAVVANAGIGGGEEFNEFEDGERSIIGN